MNNNLATIQRIKNVRHHPNADALDLVQVLGWQVVTKRDEFKEGDLAIYIVIDTVLPETPTFEFLRNKKFRIKPIRLRQIESAGICFPLDILPDEAFGKVGDKGNGGFSPKEGDDVTDILGVKHYEKPIPAELAGKMIGHIPGFLIITDEDNLRTYPDAVSELVGRPYYITRKDDGCSGTFFKRGDEFGVCSRRIHLMETEGNGFWKMAHKYDIQNVLFKTFPDLDIAIQGEICGPGIQNNKLGLKELELHVFNLFDIKTRAYLSRDAVLEFCNTNNIPMVTEIGSGDSFGYTLEELIKLANEQKYPTGGPAEGIVVRCSEPIYSTILKKTWSGKVLNENYKEKNNMEEKYYHLFLDDERMPRDVKWVDLPPYNWVIVRNYRQFVEIIKRDGVPATVSFDHDLADEHYQEHHCAHDEKMLSRGLIRYEKFVEKTGYDCAKFLANHCVDYNIPIPTYFTHTLNGIGAINIASILESARKIIDNRKS